MFKVPNEFRVKDGPMGSDDSIGNCGAFEVKWPDTDYHCVLFVIATDGMDMGAGWEHVSVHGVGARGKFTPSWNQMCFIKDLFWEAEDCVIQYHPPKSQYVNRHKNVLHLWKKSGVNFDTPPQRQGSCLYRWLTANAL
jgi:hypothetical protein